MPHLRIIWWSPPNRQNPNIFLSRFETRMHRVIYPTRVARRVSRFTSKFKAKPRAEFLDSIHRIFDTQISKLNIGVLFRQGRNVLPLISPTSKFPIFDLSLVSRARRNSHGSGLHPKLQKVGLRLKVKESQARP